MRKIFFVPILLLLFTCDNVTGPSTTPIHGCTDINACNYNPEAAIDNNSCEYLL